MNLHYQRYAEDPGDRCDVTDIIETEFLVERRVDEISGARKKQRVAVGCRAYNRFRTDDATGAWSVLDKEVLSEPLGQRLAHQARRDVVHATGRKADYDAYRSRWIGLRSCDP